MGLGVRLEPLREDGNIKKDFWMISLGLQVL